MLKGLKKIWIAVLIFCFSCCAFAIKNVANNDSASATGEPTVDLNDSNVSGTNWSYDYNANDEKATLSLNGVAWTSSITLCCPDTTIVFSGTNSITLATSGSAIKKMGSNNISVTLNSSTASSSLVLSCQTGNAAFDADMSISCGTHAKAYDSSFVEIASDDLGTANYIDFQYYSSHTHNFTYNSNEAKLIATCSVAGCELQNQKVECTLSVADITFGELLNPTIDFSAFNSATGKTVLYDDCTKEYYSVSTKGETTNGSLVNGIPTNAGYYYLKLIPAASTGLDNYPLICAFEIKKVQPTITATIANWEYGKTPSTPVVTGNTCSGTVSVEYYISNQYINPITPAAIGTYYAKVKVAATNNSLAAETTATVQIIKGKITIIWSENNYTYNGETQTITAKYENANHQYVSLAVSIENNDPLKSDDFHNAGNYTATASMENVDANMEMPDVCTASFEMKKCPLTVTIKSKPTTFGSPLAKLTYRVTGSVYDEDVFSLSSTVTAESQIGEYPITGTVNNNNYNITFTNEENTDTKGIYTIKNYATVSIDSWTYNTTAAEPQVSVAWGQEKLVYTYKNYNDGIALSGKPTEPGKYILTVEIPNSQIDYNYQYAKASDDFEIYKIEVDAPAADSRTFTYSGSLQTYTVVENATYYTVAGQNQTAAGTYDVTISLKDVAHYMWANCSNNSYNGTSNQIKYKFVIGKLKIQKPAENKTTFVYNGNPLTYTLATSNAYTISNNTTQTNPGIYDVKVNLNDTLNYCWSDDTSGEVTFKFVINKTTIETLITVDSNGNAMTETPVTLVSAGNKGVQPNAQMKVQVFDENSTSTVNNVKQELNSALSKNYNIFAVYDVSLLVDNTAVQPNGSLILKMAVPEILLNDNFKVYHIHKDSQNNTSVSEVNYGNIDNDGNVTFEIDKLSSFAFVKEIKDSAQNTKTPTEKSSNNNIVIIVIVAVVVIVAASAAVVVYLKKKNNKQNNNNSSKKTSK